LASLKPREFNKWFFRVFGTILGVLIGFLLILWNPDATDALNEFFFYRHSPFVLFLFYFACQFAFAVPFKKPDQSKSIYVGMLSIPIVYALGMHYPMEDVIGRLFYFLGQTLLFEIPIVIAFGLGIVASQLVWFFVGLNTYDLDNKKLPPETVFGYEIEYPIERDKPEIIAKIVSGTGFAVQRQSRASGKGNGWIISEKKRLGLGVSYETKENIVRIVFVLYEVVNDMITKVKDLEVALDFKAQIIGLLNNWVERKKIKRYSEMNTTTNIESNLASISEGLGPWSLFSIDDIKQTISSYPGKHPLLFALLATIFGGVIVQVILYLLRLWEIIS